MKSSLWQSATTHRDSQSLVVGLHGTHQMQQLQYNLLQMQHSAFDIASAQQRVSKHDLDLAAYSTAYTETQQSIFKVKQLCLTTGRELQ